jgi:hypothetical protein
MGVLAMEFLHSNVIFACTFYKIHRREEYFKIIFFKKAEFIE